MASKKKEELLQPEVQTQAQPAAQSTYSAEGLNSRADVEKAMANVSYRPGQQVTDAADALKQWQQNRPADYQSSYQDKINSLLGQLLERENFQYSYTRDPLYRQYEQLYTQNAHNASADAAAQAAALTGGYGSSYATSAAQQAYQQQIGGLASAIPTLYNLALDTYQSGGEELVNRLDQLNGQEQNAQTLYDRQLQDYYTQLQQKGEAYNDAYAKDYGQYQEHLNRLDTLHGYYTAQEQAEISQRQQTFNNIMTVLGVIGDVVQLGVIHERQGNEHHGGNEGTHHDEGRPAAPLAVVLVGDGAEQRQHEQGQHIIQRHNGAGPCLTHAELVGEDHGDGIVIRLPEGLDQEEGKAHQNDPLVVEFHTVSSSSRYRVPMSGYTQVGWI